MENELHDLEPLGNRDWTWIAVETTVAIVVWVFTVGLMLESYVHPPQWLSDLAEFGGAMALVIGILWWRAGRRGHRSRPAPGIRL
jgi:hypothetical protein